jgi:hypothetical protein
VCLKTFNERVKKMKPITIGKYRGLQQITSGRGTFTALALDHRQNLRKANPAFVDDAQLSHFKLDVVTALADQATSVLLDPEVSAAQAIAAGSLPGNVGLVVALESTGYTGEATARRAQIIPGWSVEKANGWAPAPSSCWFITTPPHPWRARRKILSRRSPKTAAIRPGTDARTALLCTEGERQIELGRETLRGGRNRRRLTPLGGTCSG